MVDLVAPSRRHRVDPSILGLSLVCVVTLVGLTLVCVVTLVVTLVCVVVGVAMREASFRGGGLVGEFEDRLERPQRQRLVEGELVVQVDRDAYQSAVVVGLVEELEDAGIDQ